MKKSEVNQEKLDYYGVKEEDLDKLLGEHPREELKKILLVTLKHEQLSMRDFINIFEICENSLLRSTKEILETVGTIKKAGEE